MGFWLLFKSVATVVKNVCDFNIARSCRCIKIFELLLHLGAGACMAILLGNLYNCNLLLLEGFFCLFSFFEIWRRRELNDYVGDEARRGLLPSAPPRLLAATQVISSICLLTSVTAARPVALLSKP